MDTVFYTADVSALEDERLFQAAYRAVPPARQEKIDRLRCPGDKRLSAGAALLLHLALREAGVPEDRMCFLMRGEGKPCLATGEVSFNLSHSGTVAACAVSPFEIGCDVERIGNGGLPIARRFFHPAEVGWLTSSPEDERDVRFYRLWTLKESFVKATGEGMRLPLASFSAVPGDDAPIMWNGHLYRFAEVHDVAGYCAAVCVRDGEAAVVRRQIDLTAVL